MSQILTYPWSKGYSSNLTTFRSQVKDGKNGSMPINDEIHRGNYDQNTGGVSWVASSSGSDNMDDAIAGNYCFEQNSNGRGLYYSIYSSSNKTSWSRWFDLGADGGREDGEVLNAQARSSWLGQVTGVWFLFNGKDTTQTRDCYARVEHVALRYIEEDNRKIRIRKVTEKIGDLTYMSGVRGDTKQIFGYQLDAAGRLEVSEKKFRLLGLRVQFQVRRGSTGTHKDTIQAGMDAVRFSLGDASSRGIKDDDMRALVGQGNVPWATWNADKNKLQLECRP